MSGHKVVYDIVMGRISLDMSCVGSRKMENIKGEERTKQSKTFYLG